jgi:hypothetical protein
MSYNSSPKITALASASNTPDTASGSSAFLSPGLTGPGNPENNQLKLPAMNPADSGLNRNLGRDRFESVRIDFRKVRVSLSLSAAADFVVSPAFNIVNIWIIFALIFLCIGFLVTASCPKQNLILIHCISIT